MSHIVYEPPLTHKNRKYTSKRCVGFRHFGEVNYSYPRQVVHCDIDDLVQDFNNTSAIAMELLQSCTKPSSKLGVYHIDGLVQDCINPVR